jgi:hypothetical protein
MSQAASAPLGMRILAWVSWLSLAVAVLTAATALFCQWGVNAESFGARDMGLALYFSIVGAVALVGSFYAVPVFVVLGVLSLFLQNLQRRVGFRFLAAGAVTALPLAVLTWLEGA